MDHPATGPRPPLPGTFIPSFCGLLVTATALPRGALRIVVTLPIAVYLVTLPARSSIVGSFGDRCSVSFASWMLMLRYIDQVVLSNPEKECWRRLATEEAPNTEVANSEIKDGHLTNGRIENGHAVKGQISDGHLANGKTFGGIIESGRIGNGKISHAHFGTGNITEGHLDKDGKPCKLHSPNGKLSNDKVARSHISHGVVRGYTSKPPRPRFVSTPKTFTSRLKWALQVFVSQRGVAMSHEVNKVPKGVPTGYPRWRFVAHQLLAIAYYTLLTTIYKIYAAHTPFGRWTSNVQKPTRSFLAEPLLTQFFCVWLHVFTVYASSIASISSIYALTVSLGIFKPEDCRPVFGSVRDMTTVRAAWGTTWHQLFRRVNTFPSNLVVRDILKLKKGSWESRYAQLFIGFAVSGGMHALAAVYTSGRECGEMRFFLAQAVAIMVEDHVVEVGRRWGLRETWYWRAVGYVWTVGWFSYSLRDWIGRNVGMGSWEHARGNDLGLEGLMMRAGLLGETA